MNVRTAIVSTDRGGGRFERDHAAGLVGGSIEAAGRSDECVAPSTPARVLVVEDDRTMRHLVVNYLEERNIKVASASGREEMARCFESDEPDLVTLDLRLGQDDGLDLMRELRSRSDIPVIITTGHRRDEIDRVVGLELGADDYIIKPFSLRELLARIRAVLRRREASKGAIQRDPERGRCRFGGWQLDRRARRLSNPDGIRVALTKGEYALLIAFLALTSYFVQRLYTNGAVVHFGGFQGGTAQNIGRALFTQYLLPFEVTSILILIGIVGAIVLAGKELD